MFRHMPDFNREITPAGDNHDAFGRAYLFTNENAGGYINQLNMHGGRILSVAAGGDHAFESLLNGARVVDLFDINYAQKVIVELKSRMIKSLPYEDFMDFFFEKKHFMDRKIIEPIYNDFSRELALYIDWFYCMGNCAPRHMLVYGTNPTWAGYDINKISYIASPEKYKTLAKRLPNKINFIHTGIEGLAGKYNQKYDFIFMSNIFDYIYCDIPDNDLALVQMYNNVIKPLAENNLSNENGQIMFHYMWNGHGISRPDLMFEWKNFAKKFNRIKKDAGQKMKSICVPSPILKSSKQDIILCMTQNQKIR